MIHGTEDEVIDFAHGVAIHEKSTTAVTPLWVEGAGHNDIELYSAYLERLRTFVTEDVRAPISRLSFNGTAIGVEHEISTPTGNGQGGAAGDTVNNTDSASLRSNSYKSRKSSSKPISNSTEIGDSESVSSLKK